MPFTYKHRYTEMKTQWINRDSLLALSIGNHISVIAYWKKTWTDMIVIRTRVVHMCPWLAYACPTQIPIGWQRGDPCSSRTQCVWTCLEPLCFWNHLGHDWFLGLLFHNGIFIPIIRAEPLMLTDLLLVFNASCHPSGTSSDIKCHLLGASACSLFIHVTVDGVWGLVCSDFPHRQIIPSRDSFPFRWLLLCYRIIVGRYDDQGLQWVFPSP